MRRLLKLLAVIGVSLLVAAPAQADTQQDTQLKVRIVPLDCTIHVNDYGNGPVQEITCPEDEIPPQPEPQQPGPGQPESPAPAPGQPTSLRSRPSSRIISNPEMLERITDLLRLSNPNIPVRFIGKDFNITSQHSGIVMGPIFIGILLALIGLVALWSIIRNLKFFLLPFLHDRMKKRKQKKEDR